MSDPSIRWYRVHFTEYVEGVVYWEDNTVIVQARSEDEATKKAVDHWFEHKPKVGAWSMDITYVEITAWEVNNG